jgi:hypothetical protein
MTNSALCRKEGISDPWITMIIFGWRVGETALIGYTIMGFARRPR